MRLLTTAILGIAALVLSVVIFFVDRKEGTAGTDSDGTSVLVRYEEQLVDRIAISKGGKETVVEKKQNVWFFTSPEVDIVAGESMSVLLDQLNHLTILDQITQSEMGADTTLSSENLGFGSDKEIRLVLSSAESGDTEARKQEIIIGSNTPRANTVYAKIPGEGGDTIFVVDGNPRGQLENPLKALRDKRVLAVPVEAIVQMVIRDAKGEVALQRKITQPVSPWAIVRPIETWADRDRMDTFLAALGGLKIDQVIEGSGDDSRIPNPIPDGAVVIQLAIFGMDTPLTLYLKEVEKAGGDSGAPLIEARISNRPWTYRLRSSILKTMPRTSAKLRNRALASIPMQGLDSITIQSRIDPLVYLRSERMTEGIKWDVRINDKLIPANLSEITRLVEGINSTAIQNFVSDSADDIAEYGLDPPARKVTFELTYPGVAGSDGKPTPPRKVTRALKMGWKEGDEQRLFVNFDGEPYIYEVDPTFANLFPTHPIRWRSLNVLSFNRFHLKSIKRELPGKEDLDLKYIYRRDEWEAFRKGVNVTSNLDSTSANILRDRLGSFKAAGWYLSLGLAYEALANPLAKFTIITEELDPATGESAEKKTVLKLAQSLNDVYFGQVEGSPDVFFVNSETYKNLIRPIVTNQIKVPE